MKVNCAIIDDEPLAVNLLKSYVEKMDTLSLVGAYTNAIDAMEGIRHNNIDLLFLDIQMPQLSGLELANILPSNIKIVFVTAFKEYAIEAYKKRAFDYLLKPISYEDFSACVKRLIDYLSEIEEADPIRRDGYFFVKSEYKQIKVNINDILYIEGLKDYVKFHMKNKPNVTAIMSMRKLEESLPQKNFKRIHRSYIANMDLFDYTDKSKLYYGEVGIPISETYKNMLQDFLDRHTL